MDLRTAPVRKQDEQIKQDTDVTYGRGGGGILCGPSGSSTSI